MKRPKSFKWLILGLVFFSTASWAESNRWEGQAFANFELQDQNGKLTTNSDYKGRWSLIYFYPKDKTPGCTVEAQNFVRDSALFRALNVEIIGVSYDDVESHKDFYDTYEMNFTLLADVEHDLSKAKNVDRILPWPHPSRESFIVNPKGIIVKHYEEVSPKTHSAQVLKDLKSLIDS